MKFHVVVEQEEALGPFLWFLISHVELQIVEEVLSLVLGSLLLLIKHHQAQIIHGPPDARLI